MAKINWWSEANKMAVWVALLPNGIFAVAIFLSGIVAHFLISNVYLELANIVFYATFFASAFYWISVVFSASFGVEFWHTHAMHRRLEKTQKKISKRS